MYIVTKTVNGKEVKVLTAETQAEAEYVVTAMKYNGIESASYHKRTR